MENLRLKTAAGIMALNCVKGIGPKTASKLIGRYETLGDVLNSSDEDLKLLGVNEPNRRILTEGGSVVATAVAAANAELEKAAAIDVVVFGIYDAGYPERLRCVPDAPQVIFTSGEMGLLDRSVACVGTRDPDEFGSRAAQGISSMLAEAGWCIVSGLARGVDSISHTSALNAKAPTAAILGSGIDTYASEHAYELVSRIIDQGGVVISEQLLGRQADKTTLSRRNRIQTGSSIATFFMQANVKSGTMHSVRYALRQGRPIYAPIIPDKFAGDALNEAALGLIGMDKHEFGDLIEANEEVLAAINALERNSVAVPIEGRGDYPRILEELEARLQAGKSLALSPAF